MNTLEGETIMEIYNLLGAGHSQRFIAGKLDIAIMTVVKYRRVHVADEGEPICKCGKLSTHRGRCAWRREHEKVYPQVRAANKRPHALFELIAANQPARIEKLAELQEAEYSAIAQALARLHR